jgi:hypothetical protein
VIQIGEALAGMLMLGLEGPLPEYARNQARVGLALAMRPAAPMLLAARADGGWQTAQGPWQPAAAAGAAVLHAALSSPGAWVPLDAQRSRRAWDMAVGRARTSLARVDPHLAAALHAAPTADAPGLRLREHAGQVEIRYRPAPNVRPVRVA